MRTLSPINSAVLSAVCGALSWCATGGVARADDDGAFLLPGSLVISSSTYDRSRGAVASLQVGTPLANTNTATAAAIVDTNYAKVWNNASVDASFGVTSPIRLSDVNSHNGHVLRSILVPTSQVVTSFPSKSEL